MKKRILALGVCLIMIASCFLTSCELDYETIDLGEIESAIRSEVSTQKDDEAETEAIRENGNKNNNQNNSNQNNSDKNGDDDKKEEQEKPSIDIPGGGGADMPSSDLSGVTVTVLTTGASDVYPLFGENSGEYVSDLLYKRQLEIEERLNVKLYNATSGHTVSQYSQFAQYVMNSVFSGERAFDIIEGDSRVMVSLAAQGCLALLNGLDGLNTDAEYWSANAAQNLRSRDGALFFIDGAISCGNLEKAEVVFFNEEMIDDYGLLSPYELIEENKWTVEDFAQMARNVAMDSDGNGERDIAYDTFGYVSAQQQMSVFTLFHTGENSVVYDTHKESFVLNWNTQKTIDAYERIVALLDDATAYCVSTKENQLVRNAFLDSRALFITDRFSFNDVILSESYMEMGVVPLPKADENAESYCSPIFGSATLYGIVNETEHSSAAATVLDAMASYGYKNILGMYILRKASSAQMANAMAMIYSTLHYDLSYHGNLGILTIVNGQHILSGQSLASVLASQSSAVITNRSNWDKSLPTAHIQEGWGEIIPV